MKELTIIIPLPKWNNEVKEYLDRSVDSIVLSTTKPHELIFVIPQELDKEFNDFFIKTSKELEVFNIKCDKTIQNDIEKNDFCSLINYVVNNSVFTKYFSILEYTDSYAKTWLENVEKHITLNEDISMYLPICNVYSEDGKFIRFFNEQYWAQSFSDELGFLDEESLKLLYDCCVPGAIIKKDDFLNIGGLKTSIKQYYFYEFLLRFVYNKKTAYIIPKSLYHHTWFKPKLEENEAKFYFELCKKEYFYKKDRQKTYEKN